jgi:thiamine-monophosphate kinase
MCVASGVAAELDYVPVARDATPDRALHGGDDYELLFTLPGGAEGSRRTIQGTTRIGTIVRGRAGELGLNGQPLEPKGYDHFGIDIT